MLGNMVVSQAQSSEQPSQRLLKHIIRCYLRLSDNPRLVQYRVTSWVAGRMVCLAPAQRRSCLLSARACARQGLSHAIVVLALQGTGSTAVVPSRASAQPTVHVLPEER